MLVFDIAAGIVFAIVLLAILDGFLAMMDRMFNRTIMAILAPLDWLRRRKAV